MTDEEAQRLAQGIDYFFKQAQKGDALAQYYMGIIHENGLGTAPSLEKAREWYERAAEQGLGDAKMSLGFLYAKPEAEFHDSRQAVGWFKKCAEENMPAAQNLLSKAYAKGWFNLTPCHKTSEQWRRKAIANGVPDWTEEE
jgi:TPR repeat protein